MSKRTFFPKLRRSPALAGRLSIPLALGLLATCVLAPAQSPAPAGGSTAMLSTPMVSALPNASASDSSSLARETASAAELPDAPTPQPAAQNAGTPPAPGTAPVQPVAPLQAKTIPAGWRAQRLGVKGKAEVGIRDLYSLEDFGAVILSAGYEQALNSQPNYGTDRGAFGERLGAAAIREASQGIFTDLVFASLLHDDPRYYQMGRSRNVVHRTLYAITRPLITRSDSGRETVNAPMLLGYAASAALTPAFYPPINRNFHDTVSTYGGSIGGAALGFFVSEFSTDVMIALHLKHSD